MGSTEEYAAVGRVAMISGNHDAQQTAASVGNCLLDYLKCCRVGRRRENADDVTGVIAMLPVVGKLPATDDVVVDSFCATQCHTLLCCEALWGAPWFCVWGRVVG